MKKSKMRKNMLEALEYAENYILDVSLSKYKEKELLKAVEMLRKLVKRW